jgi:hypothetical protein
MPTYCYSDLQGGQIFEHAARMGQAPDTLVIAGVPLHRDLRAEHSGQRSGDAWTEHYSFSLGARTKRHEKELARKITEAGVGFSGFDRHGRLKVDNPRHQLKLAKVVLGHDYVNKDGAFG